MTYTVERRRLERFHIPNARVVYQLESVFMDQIPVEGEGELIDLTVKAVRFESEEEFSTGVRLNIEILVPGEEEIPLIGHIVWTGKLNETGKVNSVIEFIEFDDAPEFNPPDSLEKLEWLAKQYCTFNL